MRKALIIAAVLVLFGVAALVSHDRGVPTPAPDPVQTATTATSTRA